MYELLDTLVTTHHEELREARIALAWSLVWKPDVDGHVTIGKCKKASDLDRELAAFDFIILLKKSFWLDPRVSTLQREALLDHELCHGALAYDEKGLPVEDERGRRVYRVRKHDIEEFTVIAARYGCYKNDLVLFYASLDRRKVDPFEPCVSCAETPGWVRVYNSAGVAQLQRCVCFRAWAERREAARA